MYVTVIAPDKVVLVDGKALELPDFYFDEYLHAIQFDGQQGQIEFETPDGGVRTAPVSALEVQPYVDAWQVEKARLEAQEDSQLTFGQAFTQKQEEIVTGHNVFLKAQSVKYSDMERETWSDQHMEAEALAVDSDAPAPLVRAIAKARNMDVMELVERILLKAQRWAQLAGHATGQRLAYQDALDGCTTVEEVQAITVTFTLPDDASAAFV